MNKFLLVFLVEILDENWKLRLGHFHIPFQKDVRSEKKGNFHAELRTREQVDFYSH